VGLGRALVEDACRRAREAGFAAINVISAIGTRNYYRGLGFDDAGLYQRRSLA
jgi:elongator complex protein 3